MATVSSPWIPEDDLLLKNSIEAGASLEALAKGAVNFSHRYTLREIRDRWFKERKWDTRRMLTSGGMPSSYSATVTSLAACIGLEEGVGSSSFAIAVVLACVVMYDATGVRLHAGRQAEEIRNPKRVQLGHPINMEMLLRVSWV
ncbi:putative microspherule protein [Helianthus debilis subsp. tardiflorus]